MKFKEFILHNAETIAKVSAIYCLVVITSKLNIPLTMNFGGNNNSDRKNDFYDDICNTKRVPYNFEERAIHSIKKSAIDMFRDSDKLEAAKKIYEIAIASSNEDTKRTAIKALEKISDSVFRDSLKNRITDYIYEIGRRGDIYETK